MILLDCHWFHFWLPILRSYLRVLFDGTSSRSVNIERKKHACVLWALLDMCILSFEAAVEGLRLFMKNLKPGPTKNKKSLKTKTSYSVLNPVL